MHLFVNLLQLWHKSHGTVCHFPNFKLNLYLKVPVGPNTKECASFKLK